MSTTTQFVTSLGRGEQAEASVTMSAKNPKDLDEAVKMWGAEVVFANLMANVQVGRQSFVRNRLHRALHPAKDEKPQKIDDAWKAAVQKDLDAWKPGTRQPTVSKVEKATTLFEKMSPEERAAVLAKYAGGKKAA